MIDLDITREAKKAASNRFANLVINSEPRIPVELVIKIMAAANEYSEAAIEHAIAVTRNALES
jgi:hypothetical protein